MRPRFAILLEKAHTYTCSRAEYKYQVVPRSSMADCELGAGYD